MISKKLKPKAKNKFKKKSRQRIIEKKELYIFPDEKKYPIDTKAHVLMVARYFPSIPDKNKDIVKKVLKQEFSKYQITKVEAKLAHKELEDIYYVIPGQITKINILPKEEYMEQLSEEESIENNYNSFAVIDHIISSDEYILKSKFKPNLSQAIEVELHYIFKHHSFSKILRYVYTYVANEYVLLGTIVIQTYNTPYNYDYKWLKATPKNISSKEEISKKNYFIIESYKNKIISLGKKHGVMLIPRLTFDIYNNSYMKFTNNDIVNNKAHLKDYLNLDTYLISDIHFGKRGEDIDNDIISKINTSVRYNDTILFLGDIGYIDNPNRNYLIQCMKKIQCKHKFLVLGNHDVFTLDVYYTAGILGIYEKYHDIKNGWMFSHQPCNTKENHTINFHGHIHGSKKYNNDIRNLTRKIDCYYNIHENVYTIKRYMQYHNL